MQCSGSMHESSDGQVITQQRGLLLEKVISFNHLIKTAVYTGDCIVVHYTSGSDQVVSQNSINGSNLTRKYHIDNSVNKVIYARNLKLYVAYCDDLHLRIFNQHFECLQSVSVRSTVLSLYYSELTNEVYTGGVGILYCWNLRLHLKEPLVPGNPLQYKIRKDDWVVSLSLSILSSLICVTCQNGVYIIDTKTHKQLSHLLNTHTTSFTCATLYSPSHYVITAAKDGSIKVWSYILHTELFSLAGHLKEVTGISIHPKFPFIVSSSLDGTVRVWQLQGFTQCHRYDLNAPTLMMAISTNGDILCHTHQKAILLRLNQVEYLISAVNSDILSISTYKDRKQVALVLTEDGGVRLVSIYSGLCLTILFPMFSSPMLKDVAYNVRENVMYTLLHTGEILIFNANTNPCSATQLWVPSHATENVTCISMVQNRFQSQLIAGHMSGCISILYTSKHYQMSHPCPAHDGYVINLVSSQLNEKWNDKYSITVASQGSDGIIQVWMLYMNHKEESVMQNITSIHNNSLSTCMGLMEDTLCIATNENQILVYNTSRSEETADIVSLSNRVSKPHVHTPEDAHTSTITSICVCCELNLFASCGLDGKVKVWDNTCHLVSDINLGFPISGISFTQEGPDILVGFQKQLTVIPAHKYLPSKYRNGKDKETHVLEEPIQFNSQLEFWYDPEKVPSLPLWHHARLHALNSVVTSYKPPSYTQGTVHGNKPSIDVSTCENITSTSTPIQPVNESSLFSRPALSIRNLAVNTDLARSRSKQYHTEIQKQQENLSSLKVDLDDKDLTGGLFSHPSSIIIAGKRSSNTINVSVAQSPIAHSYSSIMRKKDSSLDKVMIKEESLIQLFSEATIKPIKKRNSKFPIAPDGFIPNSVIRDQYTCKDVIFHATTANNKTCLQRTVNKIHANKKFRFRVVSKYNENNSSSECKNLVINEIVSCEKKEVSRETCREDVPKRNSDTMSSLTFVTTPVITDSPVRSTQTVGRLHSEKLMENSMTSQKREEVKTSKETIKVPVDNTLQPLFSPKLHVPASPTLDIPRSPFPQMSTSKPLTIELQAESNLTSHDRKQSIALPKLLNSITPQCSSQLTQASFIYPQAAVIRQNQTELSPIKSKDTATDKYSHQKTRSVHKEKPHDSTATDVVQSPHNTKTSQCHSPLQVLLSQIDDTKSMENGDDYDRELTQLKSQYEIQQEKNPFEQTKLLQQIMSSSWFPSSDGSNIVTSDDIFKILLDLLQSSTPPIFGEICNVISDLKCENCLGNSHKVAIVSVLLEKFQTGSSNILKSNVLKLLGQLDVCSDAVLMTILPCLTNYNVRLRNAGFCVLKQLTGVVNRHELHKLLVDMGLLQHVDMNEDIVLKELGEHLRQRKKHLIEMRNSCSPSTSKSCGDHMSRSPSHMTCLVSKSCQHTASGITAPRPTPFEVSSPFMLQISKSSLCPVQQSESTLNKIPTPFLSELTQFSQSTLARKKLLSPYGQKNKNGQNNKWNSYIWNDVWPLIKVNRLKNLTVSNEPTNQYRQVVKLPKIM